MASRLLLLAALLLAGAAFAAPDAPSGAPGRVARVGHVHHAVVYDGLRLLAPVVVEAQVPYRHQPPDGLAVDLVEPAVALLVVPHPVGEDVVGVATVVLEVFQGLRGNSGGARQNCRGVR